MEEEKKAEQQQEKLLHQALKNNPTEHDLWVFYHEVIPLLQSQLEALDIRAEMRKSQGHFPNNSREREMICQKGIDAAQSHIVYGH